MAATRRRGNVTRINQTRRPRRCVQFSPFAELAHRAFPGSRSFGRLGRVVVAMEGISAVSAASVSILAAAAPRNRFAAATGAAPACAVRGYVLVYLPRGYEVSRKKRGGSASST